MHALSLYGYTTISVLLHLEDTFIGQRKPQVTDPDSQSPASTFTLVALDEKMNEVES